MQVLSKIVRDLLAKYPDDVRRAMNFFTRNPEATKFSFFGQNGEVITLERCHVK